MKKKVVPLKNVSLNKLELISKIVLFGFLAAIVYHFVYQGALNHKDYPINTFLFLPSDRFNDLLNMTAVCKNLNPYFEPYFINSNYLPLANVFIWLLSFIKSQTILLTMYFAVASGLIYWLTFKQIKTLSPSLLTHKYTFIFTFLSYGYLFNLDRANIEIYLYIALMFFMYFYHQKKYLLSIPFLAIAVAMKIYPILFVLLFISEKKYREFAITVLLSVVLFVLPILFHQGGFYNNLYFVLNGFEIDSSSSGALALQDNAYMFQGTSLFCALKIMNIKMALGLTNLFGKYLILVVLLALMFLFYIVFIEKTLWRKVTLIVSMILILPHISFDYKFIHVLLCIILFVNEPKTEEDSTLNYKRIAILLGLLMIPKHYFYFSKITSTTSGKMDIPLASLLNPLLIIYLCYLIIYNGLSHTTKQQIKHSIGEHVQALKKSIIYIIPVVLLIIPYYSFSKKAKAEYSVYKEHNLKGQDLVSKNQNNEALPELKIALASKPHKFQLATQIANIYSSSSQWDSAMVYFNKALVTYPSSPEVQSGLLAITVNKSNALAIEELNNKKFAEANTLFEQSIQSFNKMPFNQANQGFLIGLYTNQSVCQINLEKWNDVSILFSKITALDANNEFVKSNSNFINQKLTSLPK